MPTQLIHGHQYSISSSSRARQWPRTQDLAVHRPCMWALLPALMVRKEHNPEGAPHNPNTYMCLGAPPCGAEALRAAVQALRAYAQRIYVLVSPAGDTATHICVASSYYGYD